MDGWMVYGWCMDPYGFFGFVTTVANACCSPIIGPTKQPKSRSSDLLLMADVPL